MAKICLHGSKWTSNCLIALSTSQNIFTVNSCLPTLAISLRCFRIGIHCSPPSQQGLVVSSEPRCAAIFSFSHHFIQTGTGKPYPFCRELVKPTSLTNVQLQGLPLSARCASGLIDLEPMAKVPSTRSCPCGRIRIFVVFILLLAMCSYESANRNEQSDIGKANKQVTARFACQCKSCIIAPYQHLDWLPWAPGAVSGLGSMPVT